MNYSVILLAAGKSSRFNGNKLLVELNGKPLLDHSIEQFNAVINYNLEIIVITGAFREEIENHLENKNVKVIYNKDYDHGGMISSINCGVSSLKEENFFIHPADIPYINSKEIDEMIRMMEETKVKIVVPFDGRSRGHPVLLHNSLKEKITQLRDENHGLRGLLDDYSEFDTGYYQTNNAGIHYDVDYRSDV